ncbi:FecR family protein [Mesorhizobium sp. A623]
MAAPKVGTAQQVGVSAAVNPSTRGTPPTQAVRTITLGERIIHNELIETDADGLLQILLADGTTFTVGPSSTLKIDSFVYDPDAGTASVTATLGKGVFRFIGGQTSKTPGGVTLNTPVGTVGIRGAIGDMDFSRSDGMLAYIVLRYGKEITLKEKDGQKARLYKPGYLIVIDGKNKLEIKKTPPGWTTLFQKLIGGHRGKNGGAPKPPTADMVVSSGISTTNSGIPATANAIPLPTARPPTDGDDFLADPNRDALRHEAIQAEPVDGVPGDSGTPPSDGGSGTLPPPSGGENYTNIPLRVLTAQGTSGPTGVVGGAASADQVVSLQVPYGSTVGTAVLSQGPITLPVYNDGVFAAHEMSVAQSPFGPLSGTAYSGPSGFTAYLLGIDGDPTRPFYAIRGTPTNVDTAFQGTGIRHYSLTADPIQGLGVPFMMDTGGLSSAVSSDLLIAETGNPADGSAKVFQSWLAINGSGSSQTSAIGVNVGELTGDGFTLQRRGSISPGGGALPYGLYGDASALSGASGGAIFGPDGENFVVTEASPGVGDHFYDLPDDASGSGSGFSTIHVGNLETTDTPSRTLSGPYQGFASAVMAGVEFDPSGALISTKRGFAYNSDPGSVTVDFNPAARSVGGVLGVLFEPMGQDVTLSFGHGIDGNVEDGASAYIDDNIFGAAANPDPAGTTAFGDAADYEQSPDREAATYLVSSGSVPGLSDMDFMQSVANPSGLGDYSCSTCDFLKWGWWGTQAQMVDVTATDPNKEVERLSTHLGTWVVGDIADVSQLSTTTGYYRGLAVGTVVNGSDTYVAAGRMAMEYNFGVGGSKSLSISDFDGRNFDGLMTGTTGGKATFEGGLSSSSGGYITGTARGAFVNDGTNIAAGVIGNFDAQDNSPGWSATGIIAGQTYIPTK